MFDSEMNIVKAGLGDWIGSGIYIVLYFASIVYMLVKLRDKHDQNNNVLCYSAIILFIIICNPLFTILVKSIFTYSVYWRLFWMLPMGITLAYVGVDIITNFNKKQIRFLSFVGIIICIIISGKIMFSSNNYIDVNNEYKLPNEPVKITKLILEDKGDYKKVLLPPECTAYVRQITSKIDLLYGRSAWGYDGYEIVKRYLKGDVAYIANLCKEAKCNYIVLRRNIQLDKSFADYGYDIYAETDNYVIVKTHFLKKDLEQK